MVKKKIHLVDFLEDSKVPLDNELKRRGWRMSNCGYQRQHTTKVIENVTCKICIKKYKENLK